MHQPSEQAQGKKKKKEYVLLENVNTHEETGNNKFARALGSNDFHTREKGVQALTLLLQKKKDIQDKDMLKLWKGLFYCFWHSDKAPVQEELAGRLAGILEHVDKKVAYQYFSTFITTMRREWFGIDRLRLDKFLMLVRKFFAELFRLLKKCKWEKQLVQQYSNLIQHSILLPTDTYRALGLAYHVADVLLPELSKVAEGTPVPAQALNHFLDTFVAAISKAESAPTTQRYRDAVFDPIVDSLQAPLRTQGSDDQQEQEQDADSLLAASLVELDTADLASRIFDAGAAEGVKARNREALYDISQQLQRAQKKRQRKLGAADVSSNPSQPDATVHGHPPISKVTGATNSTANSNGNSASHPSRKRKSEGQVVLSTEPLSGTTVGQASPAAPAQPNNRHKSAQQPAGVSNATLAAPVASNASMSSALKGNASLQPVLAAPATASKKSKKGEVPAADVDTSATAARSAKKARTLEHSTPTVEGSTSAADAGAEGSKPSSAKKVLSKPPRAEPSSAQKAVLRSLVNSVSTQGGTATAGSNQPAASKAPTPAVTKQLGAGKPPKAPSSVAKQAGAQSAEASSAAAGGSVLHFAAAPVDKSKPGSQPQTPVDAEHAGGEGSKVKSVLKKTGRASTGQAPPSSGLKKKGVVINLKKNLYFDFGGPVAPPEVRTPSRSKGGILKKVNTREAPASAPPKLYLDVSMQQQQGQPAKQATMTPGRVNPKRVARASAASFF